ncbi:MAG TPA: PTS system mannose/fructose/sorbose family transporter subunit IID [Gemmatimonadaceae bacterium]|nr:PTS system mannose/fructose/sorbose family transporter subunit IID [Gemmatimonadaceae bacterium]
MTAPAPASPTSPASATALPPATWAAIYLRSLAVQGSWSSELLLGPGVGFCVEPALRRLPGGVGGEPYRQALARQTRYFNAHPYLASLAIGALARAELNRVPPVQLERFRTAMCGPLGSVGDRLVWARWLPFCSAVGLLAFALGATPGAVLLIFLALYNVGHLGLRAWGLRAGWRSGLKVAGALGAAPLRQGPIYLARGVAFVAGLVLPLLLAGAVGPGRLPLAATILVALAIGATLVRLQGRVEGWRVALIALAGLALYSVR